MPKLEIITEYDWKFPKLDDWYIKYDKIVRIFFRITTFKLSNIQQITKVQNGASINIVAVTRIKKKIVDHYDNFDYDI